MIARTVPALELDTLCTVPLDLYSIHHIAVPLVYFGKFLNHCNQLVLFDVFDLGDSAADHVVQRLAIDEKLSPSDK